MPKKCLSLIKFTKRKGIKLTKFVSKKCLSLIKFTKRKGIKLTKFVSKKCLSLIKFTKRKGIREMLGWYIRYCVSHLIDVIDPPVHNIGGIDGGKQVV